MSESVDIECLADPNSVQLGLIREIHVALKARSVPHWLGGGWALDFLLDEVSRVHGDADWAIWKTDAPDVSACLCALGYTQQEVRHPEEHIGFCKLDQYVSFGLLQRTQSGDVVASGRIRLEPFVRRRGNWATYPVRSSALKPSLTRRSTSTNTTLAHP